MCWSSATRQSCAVSWPTFWTKVQVRNERSDRHFIPSSNSSLMFDIVRFGSSTEELPYLKCPLHTVLKLTPVAYGQYQRTCFISFYKFIAILFLFIYTFFVYRMQSGIDLPEHPSSQHAPRKTCGNH